MSELNIKSTTIEKGLDLAKDFLQSVMKPSLEEVGELFADKVRQWRMKNQIKNIERVKAICEKEGVKTKVINMKVLFPYLDAVALEDDETLQEMWANLFVNYIDSEKNLTTHVYPEILRQLSSEEVELIILLSTKAEAYNEEKEIPISAINNLKRLDLIRLIGVPMGMRGGTVVKSIKRTVNSTHIKNYILNYSLTGFGVDLIFACTRDKENNN